MKKTFRSAVPESLEPRTFFSLSPTSIVPHVTHPVPTVSSSVPLVPTGSGLTAEYFTGDDFQTPVAVDADRYVNLRWANQRPGNRVAASVFSVKFTGEIEPTTTGTYTFFTASDAGTRVIVNGATVIDNFTSRTKSVASGVIALTAGTQASIEVDYVSRGTGTPTIQLLWSSPAMSRRQVPTKALFPALVALPPEPLTGSYYSGANFQHLITTQSDSVIDTNFTFPNASIPTSARYSASWTGTIDPPITGSYEFAVLADNSVSLSINGSAIINRPSSSMPTLRIASISLVGGQLYPVSLTTSHVFDRGVARLSWITPGSHLTVPVPFVSPVQPPVAPSNVAASPFGFNQVDLTWGDVLGEQGFIVERSSDGGATFSQIATAGMGVTSFDDTMVAANMMYEYEIIAENSGGLSPASTAIPVTTPPASVPAPVSLSSSVAGTTATLGWTASPSATSYLVEKSASQTSGFTALNTTTGTFVTDAIPYNSESFYRVTPSNSLGSGQPSGVIAVANGPTAPTGLTATTTAATQINLHWNDVAGENGFQILESTTGGAPFQTLGYLGGTPPAGFTTVPRGITSYSVSGLTPGTAYTFEIVAISATGASAPSATAAATTSAANHTYATINQIYGVTQTGSVYLLDPTSGAATQIGTLLYGTNAAGRDPISGNVYYISTGGSSVEIAAWNPNDDSNTVITGSVTVGNPVAQTAFDDDGQGFLTTDTGDLYAFSSTTGAVTLKGTIKVAGSPLAAGDGDIAFAPSGALYLETSSTLYSITSAGIAAATGAGSTIVATDLGPTNTPNLQIAFGENGVLFGVNSSGQLYTLNTTTGAATAVGTASGVSVGDLASSPLYSQLAVSQTATSIVRSGSSASVTYTITLRNTGPDSTVGQTTLVDTLPAGFTPTSATGTGWTFTSSGSTVTATYPLDVNIASGASAPAISLTGQLTFVSATSVTNTVLASIAEFQLNTPGNSSSLTTPITG